MGSGEKWTEQTGVNSGKKRGNMWRQFLPQVFVVKGPENGVIIAFSHKFEIFPYHF